MSSLGDIRFDAETSKLLLSHSCDNMPEKSNVRKKVSILVQGLKGHIWSIMTAKVWQEYERTGHLAPGSSKEPRKMKASAIFAFSFSPFYSVQDPSPWDGVAHNQDGFLSSVKLLERSSWAPRVVSPRSFQMQLSWQWRTISQFPETMSKDPLMVEIQSCERNQVRSECLFRHTGAASSCTTSLKWLVLFSDADFLFHQPYCGLVSSLLGTCGSV